MIRKSMDHQRMIIIIPHMDSKLVWKIDSTLSSSAYLNVLQ